MSGTLACSISKPLTLSSSQSCLFPSTTKLNGSNGNHLSFPRSGGGNGNRFAVKSSSGGTAVMERRKTTTTSLYDLLRIKRNASQTEIKAAYRSLAKVYHPDAVSESDDGRDFIEIHNAYSTLSDPSSRAVYDLSLSVGCSDFRSRSSSSSPCSSPFSYASAGSRSRGYAAARRWETDQCW